MQKTFFAIFGTVPKCKSAEDIVVKFGEEYIEQRQTAKYLGMKLDQQLNFSDHANYVKSKIIGKIKLLGRVRHKLDQTTANMLYNTLILPNLDYCDYV